jgi:hypothetical protein
VPRASRILLVLFIGVLIVGGVGVGAWFLRVKGGEYLTDGAAIRVPASDAPVRSILWQPPEPLGAPFLSEEDDYEPRYTTDGLSLFFVRGRAGDNADILVSRLTVDGWTPALAFAPTNSEFDDLGPAPSPDGRSVYFYSNRPGGRGGYDLWMTRFVDGAWTAAENLGPGVNSQYNDYGPTLSVDGSTLFFSSNRPRPNEPPSADDDRWQATVREDLHQHDYDLYAATIGAHGVAEAHALATLNSPYNDGTPSMSPVGDFLYFSSDRPGGFGGFDLYRARRDADQGALGNPENLGSAINSSANELDAALDRDGFRLTFSSDRSPRLTSAERGDYDLYVSSSREVYRAYDTNPFDWAGAWDELWPSLLWLLLALLAILAILALLRRLEYRRLNLLAKCLLASALVHMLILLLTTVWAVSTSIGDLLANRDAMRVAIVSTAKASEIESQVRGNLVDVERVETEPPSVVQAAATETRLLRPMPLMATMSVAERARVDDARLADAPRALETDIEPTPLITRAAAAPDPDAPAVLDATIPDIAEREQAEEQRAITPTVSDSITHQESRPSTDINLQRPDAVASELPTAPARIEPNNVAVPSAEVPLVADSSQRREQPIVAPSVETPPTHNLNNTEEVTLPSDAAPTFPRGEQALEVGSAEKPVPHRAAAAEVALDATPGDAATTHLAPQEVTDERDAARSLAPPTAPALDFSITDDRPLGARSNDGAAPLDPTEDAPLALPSEVTSAPAQTTDFAEPALRIEAAGAAPAPTRASVGDAGVHVSANGENATLAPARSQAADVPLSRVNNATGQVVEARAPGDSARPQAEMDVSAPSVELELAFDPEAMPAGAQDPASATEPQRHAVAPMGTPDELRRADADVVFDSPPIAVPEIVIEGAENATTPDRRLLEHASERTSAAAAPDPALLLPGFDPSAAADPPSIDEMLDTLRLPVERTVETDPFPQRAPETRMEVVERMGGDEATESAVARALEWLARHQHADGRWDGEDFDHECTECGDPATAPVDTALTGLALLAFLGADHTHEKDGPYRDTAQRAIDWLIDHQDRDGGFMARGSETMYSHGIASIAISEAYAMTGDERLKTPVERAIRFILDAPSSEIGGWRYAPGQAGDTSVTGWQVMALASARKAGMDLPETALDHVRRWMDLVRHPIERGRYAYQPGRQYTDAMTAEGMFIRQLLGVSRDDADMRASARFLIENPPNWERDANTYYWYYATLAMFHYQGEAWERWNESLKNELVPRQITTGKAAGSWDPADQWADIGGRVYQTAICALCLEVYYRYLPLYAPDEIIEAVGTIRGRVVDADSNEPIPGAVVRLDVPDRAPITTRTDDEGLYVFDAPEMPEHFALSAVHRGYSPQTMTAEAEELHGRVLERDFALERLSDAVLPVEELPRVHHLGNDHFEGRINSQFQRRAEGTTYTATFDVTRDRLPPNFSRAQVWMLVKGAQSNNRIRINGTMLRTRLNDAPGDGSYGEFTAPFDIRLLDEGGNTIEIISVDETGDLDDFEFVNVQIRFWNER